MAKPKVTFGKFEGPQQDENGKEIFVDGECVGEIMRQITYPSWDGTVTNNPRGTVTGYSVELFEVSGDDCMLATLFDGKDFQKLSDATRAVREALGAA